MNHHPNLAKTVVQVEVPETIGSFISPNKNSSWNHPCPTSKLGLPAMPRSELRSGDRDLKKRTAATQKIPDNWNTVIQHWYLFGGATICIYMRSKLKQTQILKWTYIKCVVNCYLGLMVSFIVLYHVCLTDVWRNLSKWCSKTMGVPLSWLFSWTFNTKNAWYILAEIWNRIWLVVAPVFAKVLKATRSAALFRKISDGDGENEWSQTTLKKPNKL